MEIRSMICSQKLGLKENHFLRCRTTTQLNVESLINHKKDDNMVEAKVDNN